MSVHGEKQLLPSLARVSCGLDSCVATSQGTTWISGPSSSELLTTCCFFCSQWLHITIHSSDPVAAANLVIPRVLVNNKGGHSFAGNSL